MSRIRPWTNGDQVALEDGRVPANVTFADSPALDAFARLRVSNPVTLFDNQLQYDLSPLLYSNSLTGAATITHLPNESSAQLSTGGTTSGDKAIMQTKQYFRYQPGKSQSILMTAVLGSPKENVRQRIGYFDVNNGVFFEQTFAAKKVVLRSFTSGSAVDTAVNQDDWNVDTMDGGGPSGVTIDWSKAQIFFIDLEWLGTGRVRFGMFVDGIPIYCHYFNNTNDITSVYMTTANLPIRCEIENTGTAASTTTLKKICSAVVAEGGFEFGRGHDFSANRGTSVVAVTTRVPIISIRAKTTFNSIANRALIIPEHFGIWSSLKDIFYEIVYNGTLTSPTWVDVDTMNSGVQRDTAATAITGGIIIDSGYLAAAKDNSTTLINQLFQRLPFTIDFAGTTGDILTIVATSIDGVATNVTSSMTWREIR